MTPKQRDVMAGLQRQIRLLENQTPGNGVSPKPRTE